MEVEVAVLGSQSRWPCWAPSRGGRAGLPAFVVSVDVELPAPVPCRKGVEEAPGLCGDCLPGRVPCVL